MDAKKILILSIHGRGHWLAVELLRKGFAVQLVDLSQTFDKLSPEDKEGPFGYFMTERLTASQLERLVADEVSEATQAGFVIWLKEGPLELKGPVTNCRLAQLKQDDKAIDYLVKRAWQSQQNLTQIPFDKRWIVNLAHGLASSRYLPAPQTHLWGSPLALMAGYSLRFASRLGPEKSLNWLEQSGVEVVAAAQLLDVALIGRRVQGVELQAERSGLYKADWFISCLTTEEFRFISNELSLKILKNDVMEPDWSWVRYRLRLSSCRERQALPLSCLVIDSLDFAWTHENAILLKRTLSEDDFDAWVKIPTVQRFQKQYLENIGEKILSILSTRAERLNPQIKAYPQEYNYTLDELGPTVFPIFSQDKEVPQNQRGFDNLSFDSAEYWSNLTWESQFEHQTEIEKVISEWNQREIEKQAKKEKSRDREV